MTRSNSSPELQKSHYSEPQVRNHLETYAISFLIRALGSTLAEVLRQHTNSIMHSQ